MMYIKKVFNCFFFIYMHFFSCCIHKTTTPIMTFKFFRKKSDGRPCTTHSDCSDSKLTMGEYCSRQHEKTCQPLLGGEPGNMKNVCKKNNDSIDGMCPKDDYFDVHGNQIINGIPCTDSDDCSEGYCSKGFCQPYPF